MRITVVCVGKIKEKFYVQAVEEYAKRLSRYCKLDFVELADEKTPENAGENMKALIKEKEGDRILCALKADAFVIALAIEGSMLDSVQFSKKLERLAVDSVSHIMFVIGGSLGLDTRVLERADYKLSFSKMTFPHQLMRVVLLEQIYRGYRIMKGEPYHK